MASCVARATSLTIPHLRGAPLPHGAWLCALRLPEALRWMAGTSLTRLDFMTKSWAPAFIAVIAASSPIIPETIMKGRSKPVRLIISNAMRALNRGRFQSASTRSHVSSHKAACMASELSTRLMKGVSYPGSTPAEEAAHRPHYLQPATPTRLFPSFPNQHYFAPKPPTESWTRFQLHPSRPPCAHEARMMGSARHCFKNYTGLLIEREHFDQRKALAPIP